MYNSLLFVLQDSDLFFDFYTAIHRHYQALQSSHRQKLHDMSNTPTIVSQMLHDSFNKERAQNSPWLDSGHFSDVFISPKAIHCMSAYCNDVPRVCLG